METEGRTTKFVKNAVGSAIFQIVNTICGIIIPRIMLTAYGSAVNGLVSSITQFLSGLAVVEAGLALAAQQSLYKPLADDDNEKVSSIVSATRIAYNQVGALFMGLTVVLAFLYPIFAGIEDMSYLTIVALVFVLALNYVLSFFVVSKYQVLFQADQKVYVISLAKTVARIINTICIVLMASPKVDILLLRTIVSSSVVVQALIITIYAKKHYGHVKYYAKPDKSALGQRWDALYMQTLGAVTASAPAMILTFLATLEQVSVYSVYNMVFAALMGVLGIFINGINASFGTLLYSKEKDRTKEVYSEFENIYYLMISIVYTIALIMIVPFVKLYTSGITDADYLMPGLGVLFTINSFLYNLKTPQGMMIQAAGLFRKTRLQNTIQASILIVFGFLFGYFWGIYGVLIGGVLSNGYRCIDLFFFIPKNVTGGSAFNSIKRSMIMIVCGALLFILAKFVFSFIAIENLLQWVIVALIVSIVVFICFILIDFIFERKYLCATCKRMKKLFRRKNVS